MLVVFIWALLGFSQETRELLWLCRLHYTKMFWIVFYTYFSSMHMPEIKVCCRYLDIYCTAFTQHTYYCSKHSSRNACWLPIMPFCQLRVSVRPPQPCERYNIWPADVLNEAGLCHKLHYCPAVISPNWPQWPLACARVCECACKRAVMLKKKQMH